MRTDKLILSIAIAVVLPAVSFPQSNNILNSLLGCPNVSKKECTANRNCGPGEKCRETKCVDLCSEKKCGDNEGCQIIRNHSASCECLPEFERNYKGKCVLRKTCILNTDCDITEKCIDDECVNVCPDEDCEANEGCKIIDHHVGSCECLSGFLRDPSGQCVSNKTCSIDANCKETEVCKTGECVCACYKKFCNGPNEGCQVNKKHSSSCECLPGYIRNIDGQGCKPLCTLDKDCYPNQECKIIRYVPTCRCISGYSTTYDDINHCMKDCDNSKECDESEACSGFHCIDACIDSPCYVNNTECHSVDHRAVCRCRPNYVGNAYSKCLKKCSDDTACNSTEKCVDEKCIDPCTTISCTDNNHCVVSKHEPECICDNDYILHGSNCVKKCTDDNKCKDDEKCDGRKCIAACPLPSGCPENSACVASNHIASCLCDTDYYDPGNNTCLKECDEDKCGDNEMCIDHECVDACKDIECEKLYSHCVPSEHYYKCLCDDDSDDECQRKCESDNVCIGAHRCKDRTICVDACEDNPCADHTTCVPSEHKYTCECSEYYERKSPTECGMKCKIDDDCESPEKCGGEWCIYEFD